MWVNQDHSKALSLMKRAAFECNDAAALCWLGKYCFRNNVAVVPDGREPEGDELSPEYCGIQYLLKACEQNHAPAQVFLATNLESSGATEEQLNDWGRPLLEAAVAQDNADALAAVGDLFVRESGSFWGNKGRDYVAALRYYERAGFLGHAKALCNAGAMHMNGWGTPVNHLEAYRAYEQAARLGSLDAYRNIAAMHAQGLGPFERNLEAAKEILNAVRAAEEDSDPARK